VGRRGLLGNANRRNGKEGEKAARPSQQAHRVASEVLHRFVHDRSLHV
jgi:hypothetical protein